MSERTIFVLSAVVITFFAGWFVRHRGWWPDPVMQTAIAQAERERAQRASPPDFVDERVYERSGARIVDEDAMAPGVTLVVSTWNQGRWLPGVRLIDAGGRTLHHWTVDPRQLFDPEDYRRGNPLGEQDIHGAYLDTTTGELLVNVEYAGTAKLNACGNVLWTLPVGSHHTITKAPDGTYWTPAVTRAEPYPQPGLPQRVYQDHALRISADGEPLAAINMLDVLWNAGLERYIPKNRQQRPDVVHLNDVDPLPAEIADEYPFEAGDLLISLRNLHMVLVAHPETGDVFWHETRPWIMQHDPDWLGGGWIGVFDNNKDNTPRGTMLGGSRIVAVHPESGETKILFPGPESEPLYTAHRGKWDQLPNGNLLIVESAGGRVVEVGADGRTVWEWIQEPYSDQYTPSVTKAERIGVLPDTWECR